MPFTRNTRTWHVNHTFTETNPPVYTTHHKPPQQRVSRHAAEQASPSGRAQLCKTTQRKRALDNKRPRAGVFMQPTNRAAHGRPLCSVCAMHSRPLAPVARRTRPSPKNGTEASRPHSLARQPSFSVHTLAVLPTRPAHPLDVPCNHVIVPTPAKAVPSTHQSI